MQARMSWRARVRSIVPYHNESDFDLQGNGRRPVLLSRTCVKTLVMAVALVAGLSGVAQAQPDETQAFGHQVSGKFIRDKVNLPTGWVEVP
jgi:hypothetical protein